MGAVHGHGVDADTEQPITGAVFTVIWIEEIPFIGHSAEQFFDGRVAVAGTEMSRAMSSDVLPPFPSCSRRAATNRCVLLSVRSFAKPARG